MEDKSKLTSEESLEIITSMIQITKGNVKNMSFHFLLWGWVVAIGNLGHYYLMEYTTYDYPFAIWLITVPTWFVSFIYGYKQSTRARVRTYSSELLMWTWLAFSFSIAIFIFSGKFGELIAPSILLFAGTATFLTGLIIRFKPLIYGGSSFWIFAAIGFIVTPAQSLLLSAVAVVIGYLIPGYLLKNS